MICPKCGNEKTTEEWNAKQKRCKRCWADYMKARYRNNAEARAAQRASNDRWKEANRDTHLALMKRWREEHPEQFKAARDKWAVENRDRDRELHCLWRDANPDRWREIRDAAVARSEQRNPYRMREVQRRRRAAKQATQTERIDYNAVLAKTEGCCGICGELIDTSLIWPDRMSLEFDHIVPLLRGGSHTYDNLQPAHARCNRKKAASLSHLAQKGL